MLLQLVTSSSSKQHQNIKQIHLKGTNTADQHQKTVSAFKTEEQSFATVYTKTDHLQRFYNENALNYFAELIAQKYSQNMKSLSILDLCCGYGLPTLSLRKKLKQKGVKIEKIVGYDVSHDMITYAQQNSQFPEAKFHRLNIQTELQDQNEYDVAICLFGLHWMNNLDSAVSKIHKSLKNDGLFLTLTPIDIHDLFHFRTSFIENSRWSSLFREEWKLKPFIFEKQRYLEVFNKYFSIIREEKKQTKFHYTFNQVVSFFQSWLPEVRHLFQGISHQTLRDVIAKSYISQFLQSVEKNTQGNLLILKDGSAVFTQHTFHFDGIKK